MYLKIGSSAQYVHFFSDDVIFMSFPPPEITKFGSNIIDSPKFYIDPKLVTPT